MCRRVAGAAQQAGSNDAGRCRRDRMTIADGYADVRARVARAAERAGRDPSSVRIVAAGKYATAESILEAARAGVTDVGENRAQDLRDKHRVVGDAVTWHFLGGVQTNK